MTCSASQAAGLAHLPGNQRLDDAGDTDSRCARLKAPDEGRAHGAAATAYLDDEGEVIAVRVSPAQPLGQTIHGAVTPLSSRPRPSAGVRGPARRRARVGRAQVSRWLRAKRRRVVELVAKTESNMRASLQWGEGA
jgi:hypothetical protein